MIENNATEVQHLILMVSILCSQLLSCCLWHIMHRLTYGCSLYVLAVGL